MSHLMAATCCVSTQLLLVSYVRDIKTNTSLFYGRCFKYLGRGDMHQRSSISDLRVSSLFSPLRCRRRAYVPWATNLLTVMSITRLVPAPIILFNHFFSLVRYSNWVLLTTHDMRVFPRAKPRQALVGKIPFSTCHRCKDRECLVLYIVSLPDLYFFHYCACVFWTVIAVLAPLPWTEIRHTVLVL